MIGWAEEAHAALARGPAALVTILATEGSVPRGAGTRMIVTGDAIGGTIGGGRLELQAIQQARAILALPAGAWRVQDYPLGPLLGQCCGGRVRLLVERLAEASWLADAAEGALLVSHLGEGSIERSVATRATVSQHAARGPMPVAGDILIERLGGDRRPVTLIGAGHVGRAIARALAGLPFDLAWFDNRPEMADHPGVVLTHADALSDCIAATGPEGAVLIVTHDHDLDYRLVATALRSEVGFIGLIGSATKRARFMARLGRDGFDAGQQARVRCPIGLPGIAGKEPEVIAIAVAAQLLMLREQG